MSAQFFDLRDDVELPGRWFLKGPFDAAGWRIDGRVFTEGKLISGKLPVWGGGPVDAQPPLTIPIRHMGTELAFTFADFDMPVVTAELGQALERLAPDQVQRIPVHVESVSRPFEILNVTSTIPCLDEAKSVYRWWTEADGEPEKIGKYMGVHPISIIQEKTAGRDLFRISGWEIALIVSARVKNLFDSFGVCGVKFKSVT